MPELTGQIRNESGSLLSSVRVHAGFAFSLSRENYLNTIRRKLLPQSMCWTRKTEQGLCLGFVKQILNTDSFGCFSCWYPDECEIQIAIHSLGYSPWISTFFSNQLNRNHIEAILCTAPKKTWARVEVAPEKKSVNLAGATLKGVYLSLVTQPDLPIQHLDEDGRFWIDHLIPEGRYGFALFVPDGQAPFHGTIASPTSRSTIIFSSQSQ